MELYKTNVTVLKRKFHNYVNVYQTKEKVIGEILKTLTLDQISHILSEIDVPYVLTEKDFWKWIEQFEDKYTYYDIVHDTLSELSSIYGVDAYHDFLKMLSENFKFLYNRFVQYIQNNEQTRFKISEDDDTLKSMVMYFIFKGGIIYNQLIMTYVTSSDTDLSKNEKNLKLGEMLLNDSPRGNVIGLYDYPSWDDIPKVLKNAVI